MNVMKKNKLAGKFSLLHRLNTDTVIIGLLPGINVNELTSTDLRYLAAFILVAQYIEIVWLQVKFSRITADHLNIRSGTMQKSCKSLRKNIVIKKEI